jgi:hypothetical protein
MLNGRLMALDKEYRKQLYEDVIFCFNSQFIGLETSCSAVGRVCAFCFNSQFFGLETSYRAVGSEKEGGV